jgi:hypothetical protein
LKQTYNLKDLSVTNIKLNEHICNLKNLKNQKHFVLKLCHILPIDYVTMFLQIMESGEQIGLKHFKPIKPLGSGDTGRYFFFLSCFPFSNIQQLINEASTYK